MPRTRDRPENNLHFAPVIRPTMMARFSFAIAFHSFLALASLNTCRAQSASTTKTHQAVPTESPQWQEIELSFDSQSHPANDYTDTEAWVEFRHDGGDVIQRPMFFDGGNVFRVRFASPRKTGEWQWRSFGPDDDAGLDGRAGKLTATENRSSHPTPFDRHGFWSIPAGERQMIHADGTPGILVADTPWALPWRATPDQVETYAADRQSKGFNAALLMTVQPDREARGPRSRTVDLGFDVGFDDLPQGTLRQLNPAYFQTMDRLMAILLNHGIAPVYQPVFHGYGWKGRKAAGRSVSAEDYARYCRYLVARYGARPAIWLIGGDSPGISQHIVHQYDVAGQMITRWDAYQHPTGLHYGPNAVNRTHQDKDWLDFQWCQTGHSGSHVPERIADMWRNTPIKAVANGEPTYENIGRLGRATGWWQGHEAWCNLTAGGTMGIVYGAASLWQWKRHPNEPDHADWCVAPGAGWREALDFPGSTYVGMVGKILNGLPLRGMQPNWTYTYGKRGLSVPGRMLLLYLPEPEDVAILSMDVPRPYYVVDAASAAILSSGTLEETRSASARVNKESGPKILIFLNHEDVANWPLLHPSSPQ